MAQQYYLQKRTNLTTCAGGSLHTQINDLCPKGNCAKLIYGQSVTQYIVQVNIKILYLVFLACVQKIRTWPRIYFVNGKNHLLNLENAAPKCGCIDLSGSYTGSADSMRLRTCRGSAAQRQPANTRPEARAQEMARKQNRIPYRILCLATAIMKCIMCLPC